jgi:hypothetical protein
MGFDSISILYVKYSASDSWSLPVPEAGVKLGKALRRGTSILAAVLLCLQFPSWSAAQDDERVEPGHSIGKVSTRADLIVLELDDRALGGANLFDLEGHTLHFTPEGSRYRVQAEALQWDSNFGPALTGAEVTLKQFAFSFSGQKWNAFRVGTTGSIRFGAAEQEANPSRSGSGDGGVSIGRFDPLAEAASAIINRAPAICVFFKPRMSGLRFVKELSDRVIITWDLTEPFGNIQDFTWFKTVNRFQAVLHRDGSIDMSYQEIAAKDAMVGVYPVLAGPEKTFLNLTADPHPELPAHLDVRNLKLSVVDGVLLRATFETRGPVLAEGDSAIDGITYRVVFDSQKPTPTSPQAARPTLAWTILGVARYVRSPRYVAFGPGALRTAKVAGNTITVEGSLPPALRGLEQIYVSAEVAKRGDHEPAQRLSPRLVKLTGIRSPEVHFSSLTRQDGPFAIAYEPFHYLSLPRPQDLSCTVIHALGDKFDFLAYYSDFRIDNQEAGTPSDGPKAGNVQGTGEGQHDMEAYCSQGRFQWGYVQPVYVGSNQMQERPPEGAPVGSDRDITFYTHQLEESSPDHKMRPYNYAMSQLGHEMGHRWSAFVSAKVGGETIALGPVHWARGLEAPVAFPYQRPTEASAMGGGVWQDNFDGTFTQLDDDYYVPATGYSYLDLYLMGLISPAEVPDFFILRNLVPSGKDANGHPIFKAERTKITIGDVIAAEGPRLPDVDHSQRNFNTGIVLVVEHGHVPSHDLMERADRIRQQWIDYWETTTGHRASMTATPH